MLGVRRLGVWRLRLPQPVGVGWVIELGVSNAFGRWMHAAGWRGFTLPLPGLTILFYWLAEPDEPPDPFVRVHEFVHARQHRRLPFFAGRYLLALFTDGGYRRNRFEVEAYRVESEAHREGLPGWARLGGPAGGRDNDG
jgi:hypothetical protein